MIFGLQSCELGRGERFRAPLEMTKCPLLHYAALDSGEVEILRRHKKRGAQNDKHAPMFFFARR